MINLAIIGTGGMAHGHAHWFSKIKGVKISACSDISRERATAFAAKWNIPGVYNDYREMLVKEDLDGVVNVTPDHVHAPVALATINQGLHILSEKPLAANLAEARKMAKAAGDKKVRNMVHFTYRNSAALLHASRFIRRGGIGRIFHLEGSYLQGWLSTATWGDWRTDPGWTWRLSTKHGSAGTLGDLGCHIYDMARLLCGDIASIDCRLKTFDKGIPGNRIGKFILDANDTFISTVEFKNGALGTIHSTRWATGQDNSLRTRVWGEKGAVEIDLDVSYTDYKVYRKTVNRKTRAWKTAACRPVPNLPEKFIRTIRSGKDDDSNFANGLKIQAYLHYSRESAKKKRPVKIKL